MNAIGHDGRKKNLRETLSCPVCDRLPTPPVYGCQNGHIICEACKAKVRHCSVCRAERFCVRYLIVEDLLATKILPCENESAGCRQPLMTGPEYTVHIQSCSFRQIECDCRDGGCDCQSRLIPYKSYLDHLSGFHEAKTVEDKTMCIQCDIDGPFTPRIFHCYDRTFILMSHRNPTQFWSWIAMMGSENDLFYVRITLRYKLPLQSCSKLASDTLTVLSVRESPEDVLKSGQCLEFSVDSLPDTAPPCVWPQYEPDIGEFPVRWGYDIQIWEPTKMRLNKTVALRKSATSAAATDRPRPGNSQTPSEMALPSICSTGKFQFNSYDARPPVLQPSSSDPAGFYRNFQPVAVKAPCGQAVEDDDDEYYSDDDDSEYFPQKEGKHAVKNQEIAQTMPTTLSNVPKDGVCETNSDGPCQQEAVSKTLQLSQRRHDKSACQNNDRRNNENVPGSSVSHNDRQDESEEDEEPSRKRSKFHTEFTTTAVDKDKDNMPTALNPTR